jgi:hypothetical protein
LPSTHLTALLAEAIAVERQREEILAKILTMEIGIIVRRHVWLVSSAAAREASMNPVREARVLP